MSQGPLCPNLSQKVQKEVSQMANCNLPYLILLGGLSVYLNHLKIKLLIVTTNWQCEQDKDLKLNQSINICELGIIKVPLGNIFL